MGLIDSPVNLSCEASGCFHGCQDRIGLGDYGLPVRALLFVPQGHQIAGGFQGPIHPLSMRGEPEGRNMGIVVARQPFFIRQSFEHDSISHGNNLPQPGRPVEAGVRGDRRADTVADPRPPTPDLWRLRRSLARF